MNTNEERIPLLAEVAYLSNNPQIKITYGNELISLIKDQSDVNRLIAVYGEIATAYKLLGDLDLAVENFFISAAYADSVKDELAKADALANIAMVYNSKGEYRKSLELSQRAIDIYEETQNISRLAAQYLNHGNTLYYLDLLDSSIKYLQKSYDIVDSEYVTSYIDGTMALVMAKIGATDSSEALLMKALQTFAKFRDNYAFSDCLVNYGGLLIDQGKIEKGMGFTARGYHQARANGLKEQIQNGAKILSEAYRIQGNYPKALEYQTAYYAYRDSLINAESIQKIADQRTAYEVGQKQAEVDLLQAQRETQRIVVISLIIVLTIIFAFAIVILRFYQSKNRLSKELALQKEQLEALNNTKDKFFSIISHDLRSPVAAFMGLSRMIKLMVKNKQTDDLLELTGEIDTSVDRLSSLLDNLLNWATQQQDHIPYIPEKIDIKTIIDDLFGVFANMAHSKKIELVNEIMEPVLLWADKNTTATIFRNLINNALKFTKEGGKVIVAFDEQNRIAISDTGIGMNTEKIEKVLQESEYKSSYGTAGEKGLGLGLQLVKEFVKLNKGNLELYSEESRGTTFSITLPMFVETEEKTESLPS